MNAQTELIPKTAADEAREVLVHLEAEVTKRSNAVATAREKYHEAVEWADKQRELVARLEAQEEECEVVDEGEVRDPIPQDDEPEDAEVLELDGVAVTEDGTAYETATGEVVDSPAEIDPPDESSPCTGCEKADCDGCEHATQVDEEASVDEGPDEGVVYVRWPDMADPVESEVGPLTRYGELIADSLNEGEDAADYEIIGLIDEDMDVYPVCDPSLVIPRSAWGQTFSVVAKAGAS